MAHSIHVGFLSVDHATTHVIAAMIEQNIISAKNIYVSDKDSSHRATYDVQGLCVLSDDPAVLMKSEIVVIAESKRELGTVLAPLCALTRGKILIVLCDGIDCEYVLERVTRGTFVAVAAKENTEIFFSSGFPEYMKDACEDIISVSLKTA